MNPAGAIIFLILIVFVGAIIITLSNDEETEMIRKKVQRRQELIDKYGNEVYHWSELWED